MADIIEHVTRNQRDGQCGASRRLWFRGHSNVEYTLVPSVFRSEDNASDKERNQAEENERRLNLERSLVHQFRARAAIHLRDQISYQDKARWLALMQHHRLPTRLLDWSRSPLVAAYFAVEPFLAGSKKSEVPEGGAAIWILDPWRLNVAGDDPTNGRGGSGRPVGGEERRLGVVNALDSETLHKLVADAFYEDDRVHMKNPAPHSDHDASVRAAFSVEHDIRMFAQRGCFTVHGAASSPLEKSHPEALTKLVIPAKQVDVIAREIILCGFAEGDIYPDLDHLANELSRTARARHTASG